MSTTPSTHALSDPRRTIADAVSGVADEVIAVSRQIHALAEPSFEEHKSAELLAGVLERKGFDVVRALGGLPTAFHATRGTGRLEVGLFLEYDALPDVGHACGHNLIAGAGLAAALGLLPVLDELGVTLHVFGTPAEEHGGGKVGLLDGGAFDALDIAMMVHPFPEGLSFNPAGTSSQVVGRFRATFRGVASHSAAAPHLGVNAADAAVVAQVAVGLLRQQVPSDHRIALFVAEAGSVTNIIPALAIVNFECRAFTRPEFDILFARVARCFEAGALATGASLEIDPVGPVYDALVHDEILSEHWSDAMSVFGHDVSRAPGLSGGSTDMGNVSQLIPTIHPWVGIPGATSPVHSHDFAVSADTQAAYDVMVEAALGMAWTVASVAASSASDQFHAAAIARRALQKGIQP